MDNLADNKHVAVIGCGTIGRRVGLVWAMRRGKAVIFDIDEQKAFDALSWIQSKLPLYAKSVGSEPGRLEVASNLEGAVRNAWMVAECTPEVLETKCRVLGEIDRFSDPTTIITTNSSSFKSGELIPSVTASGRARVLNAHYAYPPERPTVEVMSCGHTDPNVIQKLLHEILNIGLEPVVVNGQSTGLIGNRVWAAIKREVMMVLADQIGSPQDIDKLFRSGFESRLAPCQIMDEVGLQTVCDIEEHYIRERGNIPTYPLEYLREHYVAKGRLGRMTGRGLLDYSEPRNGGPLRDRLIGTWELVEYANSEAGKDSSLADKIEGMIIYASSGYMSAQLQVPGQAPFISEDFLGGSEKDYTEAGKRYFAYTGPFFIEESQTPPVVRHHVTHCSFPNWQGQELVRLANVKNSGDSTFLYLTAQPTDSSATKRVTLCWRKLPDNWA